MPSAVPPTGRERDARAARASLDTIEAIARVRGQAAEQRTTSSRLDPVCYGDRGREHNQEQDSSCARALSGNFRPCPARMHGQGNN